MEDSEHGLIFREHIRLEPKHTRFSGDLNEMSKDEARDPVASIVGIS
jgi:hypothetical protein